MRIPSILKLAGVLIVLGLMAPKAATAQCYPSYGPRYYAPHCGGCYPVYPVCRPYCGPRYYYHGHYRRRCW